jgi:hypothetical protein
MSMADATATHMHTPAGSGCDRGAIQHRGRGAPTLFTERIDPNQRRLGVSHSVALAAAR